MIRVPGMLEILYVPSISASGDPTFDERSDHSGLSCPPLDVRKKIREKSGETLASPHHMCETKKHNAGRSKFEMHNGHTR